MFKRRDLLTKIYRLKLMVLGAAMLLSGLGVSLLASWASYSSLNHLVIATLQSLSDALIVTGGLGVGVDFLTGHARDEADAERTRDVLRELTPDFTDAVLRGMAVHPEDLRRIASPELLDTIATNALALRLGDEHFAAEIYQGLVTQAIQTPERWEDVDVDIRLASIQANNADSDLNPRPLFSAMITWEYTTTLDGQIRRFVATDDPDEFREFLSDGPASAAWFVP